MLHDDLLEDLECPICCEYLIPPIRMCTTGHSICNQCREKIKVCPMCNSEFSTGRNVTLENLAHKIKYPCEYRRHGCTKKMDLEERMRHQKNCSYKIIKCPKENCQFTLPLRDLINHCWQTHEYSYLTPRYDVFYLFRDHTFSSSFSNSCLLKHYDNKNVYFWFRAKIVGWQVYLTVQMLAEPEEASKYKFQIQITDGIRSVLFSDTCQSIFVDDEDLFNISACCFLSLRSYVFYSKSELFTKTVTIEKIEKKKNNSRYYLFVLMLTLGFYLFQYYFYPIDSTIFSAPSFSDSKENKVKIKHKSKKHHKHLDDNSNDLNYEDLVLICFVLPVVFSLFIIVFKILRRFLTFIGI